MQPELMSLDIKILEEEYTALLSDESGEAEYLHSLQSQAEKLKVTLILISLILIDNYVTIMNTFHLLQEISYIAKCGCGEKYSVGLL